MPGRGYKDYRLGGFSSWLREHVTNSGNWGKIRRCIAESDVCVKLDQEYVTADQFFAAHISPLQVKGSVFALFWVILMEVQLLFLP